MTHKIYECILRLDNYLISPRPFSVCFIIYCRHKHSYLNNAAGAWMPQESEEFLPLHKASHFVMNLHTQSREIAVLRKQKYIILITFLCKIKRTRVCLFLF
jgi:hypothetical protein